MKLGMNGSDLSFENSENSFRIYQSVDNDIWFESKKPNITSIFNYQSENPIEWRSAEIFSDLLKKIIGQSVLHEDTDTLPDDFIDVDNKCITWHSDGSIDNVLKIQYCAGNITVSLNKGATSKPNSNKVRIRTKGSEYGLYYKHFLKLHEELLQLASQEERMPKDQEQKKNPGMEIE